MKRWDQHFEGVVESVDADTFTARLVDLTNAKNVDELAEFPMRVVARVDRGAVSPGAVFDWFIRVAPRVNRIVFRRAKPFTPEQIEAAGREAERLAAIFGDDL